MKNKILLALLGVASLNATYAADTAAGTQGTAAATTATRAAADPASKLTRGVVLAADKQQPAENQHQLTIFAKNTKQP